MKIMQKWVPLTYDAFLNNRLRGLTISEDGVSYLKSLIRGKKPKSDKISRRELDRIKNIFNC